MSSYRDIFGNIRNASGCILIPAPRCAVSEEESVLKPLSAIEAAIRHSSPGDLALLMIAVSRREDENKGKMKIEVSPYHRNWTLGGGLYDISMDIRHPSAYDVCKDNHILACRSTLASAVEFILNDQGWSGCLDIPRLAAIMAGQMQHEATTLHAKAIRLGQMKAGE